MPDGTAITDDPGDDYDMLRSVRFARGRVNGEEATLLLVGSRQAGSGPTDTAYQVFRLVQRATGYQFELLSEQRLPNGFCNADMALSVASGLPLRNSYRGPRTPDGCRQASN